MSEDKAEFGFMAIVLLICLVAGIWKLCFPNIEPKIIDIPELHAATRK